MLLVLSLPCTLLSWIKLAILSVLLLLLTFVILQVLPTQDLIWLTSQVLPLVMNGLDVLHGLHVVKVLQLLNVLGAYSDGLILWHVVQLQFSFHFELEGFYQVVADDGLAAAGLRSCRRLGLCGRLVFLGVVPAVQTFLVGVQLSDNLILNIVKVQRLDTRRVLHYLDAEILVARYPDVDENQSLKSFLLILMICIGLYLLLEVQLGHVIERLLGHEWQ